jgi:glycine/D-amino acid oxidase-like deaminating enzyme
VSAPHASVWWATLPAAPLERDPLPGDLDVDVAIVGAGFTGLWTAVGLLRHQPTLRVAVLEATVAGAGASGRNGGWASALYPLSFTRVAATHGETSACQLRQALRRGVSDLYDDATKEGISFDFCHGGTVTLARSDAQAARLQQEIAAAVATGDVADDLRWLDRTEARQRCGASDVRGAMFTPHCAAIHPAKLVTGLAAAAERRGARVYEGTRARAIQPGTRFQRPSVVTDRGVVRADVVVRATEAFTGSLDGTSRAIVPLYSLVVATEPLPASFFDRVGLAARETFNDARHLIIYGQRTADDRLVFGGRGAPYHFGSRVDPAFDDEPDVFARLEATLAELFGELPVAVSHRWGGPVALTRDQSPYVVFDKESGVARVGGYLGDGVTLSRLAALSLADLIADVDSPATHLPFVGNVARRWEPEPFRWLGINAGILAANVADRREAKTGKESVASKVLGRLQGNH